MAAIEEYKNGVYIVTPQPLSGSAGQMLNDNAKALADEDEAIAADLATHEALSTSAHGGIVPSSRTISTTAPLSGGGDLASNLTLSIDTTDILARANHTGTQAISTVSGLQAALDAKAASTHSHAISDVTSLQTALDAKLSLSGGTMTGILIMNGNDINNAGLIGVAGGTVVLDEAGILFSAGELNMGGRNIVSGGTLSATTGSFSSTLSANTTSTLTRNGIAATSTDGLIVQNTTAATTGTQVQRSPRLRLRGTARKTNATAASQTQDWVIENLPVAGAASTSATLQFNHSNNGAAYTTQMSLTSGGSLLVSAVNATNVISNSITTSQIDTFNGTLGFESGCLIDMTSCSVVLDSGSINGVSDVTFASGGNLNMDGGTINLDSSGSSITTSDGQVAIQAGSGPVYIVGDLFITGNLDASTSDLTVNSLLIGVTSFGITDTGGASFDSLTLSGAGMSIGPIAINSQGTGNLDISGGAVSQNNIGSNPTMEASRVYTYMTGTLYVIAYNDGGTDKFRYMDLASTNATWTYTTTAP